MASPAIRSGRRHANEFRPASRSTYWSTPLPTARSTSSSTNRERWHTNRRTTCAHESGAFAAKKSLTSAAEQSASASANLSSKIGSRSTRAWAARNCAVMIAVRLAPSMVRSYSRYHLPEGRYIRGNRMCTAANDLQNVPKLHARDQASAKPAVLQLVAVAIDEVEDTSLSFHGGVQILSRPPGIRPTPKMPTVRSTAVAELDRASGCQVACQAQ